MAETTMKRGLGEGECYCMAPEFYCHHHAPRRSTAPGEPTPDDELTALRNEVTLWRQNAANDFGRMMAVERDAELGAALRAALDTGDKVGGEMTISWGRETRVNVDRTNWLGMWDENDATRELARLLRHPDRETGA